MNVKRFALALCTVGTVAFASVSTSAARPPEPIAPAQAAALAAGPASIAGRSDTHAVSAQAALAAAQQQGAQVWTAPGLTLKQAVGVDKLRVAPSPVPAAEERTACSANAQSWSWGTWPYDQTITDTTYWCAVPGVRITYRSSSASASGTLCGGDWTTSQLVAGGVGYTWFTIRSSAGWSCPTAIPWVTIHPSHHVDVARNAWGSTQVTGSG